MKLEARGRSNPSFCENLRSNRDGLRALTGLSRNDASPFEPNIDRLDQHCNFARYADFYYTCISTDTDSPSNSERRLQKFGKLIGKDVLII